MPSSGSRSTNFSRPIVTRPREKSNQGLIKGIWAAGARLTRHRTESPLKGLTEQRHRFPNPLQRVYKEMEPGILQPAG
jgi:hypothetical protein